MNGLQLLPRLAAIIMMGAIFVHSGVSQKSDSSPPRSAEPVLWRDPGNVESLDFRYGAGGSESQPEPPFTFVSEDLSGTRRKMNVTDARGVRWNVKWGSEARPSTFCTRLAWACGYFVEPEYFIASGRIDGAHGLTRTKSAISAGGSFENARFQLRSDALTFLKGKRWSWTENPFVGTSELQGLKILTMLVSNWDAKNSNLGVFEDSDSSDPVHLYALVDWGDSMGKWGRAIVRSVGRCNDFASQTPDFVKMEDGRLRWGFTGVNKGDLKDNLTVSDMRWLLQYLGRITDEQIQDGLAASGATPHEMDCYVRSLRQRIVKLQQLAASDAISAR